jgi:hypothetical protein
LGHRHAGDHAGPKTGHGQLGHQGAAALGRGLREHSGCDQIWDGT